MINKEQILRNTIGLTMPPIPQCNVFEALTSNTQFVPDDLRLFLRPDGKAALKYVTSSPHLPHIDLTRILVYWCKDQGRAGIDLMDGTMNDRRDHAIRLAHQLA